MDCELQDPDVFSLDYMQRRKWCRTCGEETGWDAKPHSKDECIRYLKIRGREQDARLSGLLFGFRCFRASR